ENTHDDAFAMVEGRRRDTQIDVETLLRVLLEDDAAVLRQAAFRNVEVAHDLQAGDERRTNLRGKPEFFLTHAVDAVPHDDFLFPRFDMDIGRAAEIRILDDAV